MDGLIAYALSKKYVDGKTIGIATGMSWKGTKENISNLPQSGNSVGDLWHVNEDGNEYAWDGSKWEALGGIGSSATVDSALSSTSENPVQNKVINTALSQKGTYSKPSGGIPKTDLAADVQTSLGKADTALQQHQSLSGYATESWVQNQGYLTQHQDISGKADKTPRIAKASTDTVATIDPNKLYVFPEMSALTITLAAITDSTIVNEYHFIFESGATATTTTFPAIPGLSDFAAEADTVYEVSILEGRALVTSWEVPA